MWTLLVIAISRQFRKLSSLHLKASSSAAFPVPAHQVLGQTVPLSTLTFPSLLALTLPNFAASNLNLTATNYPKLETLSIERMDFNTYPMTVNLQLPTLQTLSMNGIVTDSLSMAASLCPPMCPRLSSVDLQCVSFQPLARGESRRDTALFQVTRKSFPKAHHPPWLLDMPACESLQLCSVDTPCIYLHAPNLCELAVSNCGAVNAQQDFFTLLPDVFAEPEFARRTWVATRSTAAAAMAAAAAEAAATAAATAATAAAAAAAAAVMQAAAAAASGAAVLGSSSGDGHVLVVPGVGSSSAVTGGYLAGGRHVQGRLGRLKIAHNTMGSWVGTPSYHALCRDARVNHVEDVDASENWFHLLDDAEDWEAEWGHE